MLFPRKTHPFIFCHGQRLYRTTMESIYPDEHTSATSRRSFRQRLRLHLPLRLPLRGFRVYPIRMPLMALNLLPYSVFPALSHLLVPAKILYGSLHKALRKRRPSSAPSPVSIKQRNVTGQPHQPTLLLHQVASRPKALRRLQLDHGLSPLSLTRRTRRL